MCFFVVTPRMSLKTILFQVLCKEFWWMDIDYFFSSSFSLSSYTFPYFRSKPTNEPDSKMGKAFLNMFLFPLSKERTYLNMSPFHACAQNCTETKNQPTCIKCRSVPCTDIQEGEHVRSPYHQKLALRET